MKKLIILAAVLALFTGSASATEYQKVITYKTVTIYVEKQVPYTANVVKYDSYGCPHTVTMTKYKTIEVPVQKQVPVVSYIPVCE